MHEEYRYKAGKLGEALMREPFSADELDYCRKRLPPLLVEFLEYSGHAVYANGGVTVCKPSTLEPILELVFKNDPDLNTNDCTVVSYNPFGELGIWSKTHRLIDISLAEGEVSSQALAPTEFHPSLMPDVKRKPDPNIVASGAVISSDRRFDFLDFAGERMLERCVKAHGPISLGECYGFFPALGLVGQESPMRRVDNIRRVSALEHFAILAQLQPFYLINIGPSGIEKVREIG